MRVEMSEEMKKARREYMRSRSARAMREWRRKNPEKAKDIQIRYWQKRADRMRENEHGDAQQSDPLNDPGQELIGKCR